MCQPINLTCMADAIHLPVAVVKAGPWNTVLDWRVDSTPKKPVFLLPQKTISRFDSLYFLPLNLFSFLAFFTARFCWVVMVRKWVLLRLIWHGLWAWTWPLIVSICWFCCWIGVEIGSKSCLNLHDGRKMEVFYTPEIDAMSLQNYWESYFLYANMGGPFAFKKILEI